MIQPYIIGRGMAGRALAKAIGWLERENVAPIQWVERSAALTDLTENSLVCIANPHGLHRERLEECEQMGGAIICEKPVAVTLEDIEALETFPKEVAVCHGYRMHWGPQTIKYMVTSGELGEIIAIEGRYWQSSAARGEKKSGWKQDPQLSGPFDTLMDLGTHWVDMASYILEDFSPTLLVERSYKNAPARHRDTHVHLLARWGACMGNASISKTFHGEGNRFEIQVVGTKRAVSWEFQNPDGIWISEGAERGWFPRDDKPASGMAAFHGLGWMEGYLAIVSSVLDQMGGKKGARTPSLKESLSLSRAIIEGADRASLFN